MWCEYWAPTGSASIWNMAAAPPPRHGGAPPCPWRHAAITLAAAGATQLAPPGAIQERRQLAPWEAAAAPAGWRPPPPRRQLGARVAPLLEKRIRWGKWHAGELTPEDQRTRWPLAAASAPERSLQRSLAKLAPATARSIRAVQPSSAEMCRPQPSLHMDGIAHMIVAVKQARVLPRERIDPTSSASRGNAHQCAVMAADDTSPQMMAARLESNEPWPVKSWNGGESMRKTGGGGGGYGMPATNGRSASGLKDSFTTMMREGSCER